MSKPKLKPLTLVVCETYGDFTEWLADAGDPDAQACWVRSARQLTAHSGQGAQVLWTGTAHKRSDYAALQAAFKASYFQ